MLGPLRLEKTIRVPGFRCISRVGFFVKDALIWVEVVGKIGFQEDNVRFLYVVQDQERETNRIL